MIFTFGLEQGIFKLDGKKIIWIRSSYLEMFVEWPDIFGLSKVGYFMAYEHLFGYSMKK